MCYEHEKRFDIYERIANDLIHYTVESEIRQKVRHVQPQPNGSRFCDLLEN
jgi:hypothetical protein